MGRWPGWRAATVALMVALLASACGLVQLPDPCTAPQIGFVPNCRAASEPPPVGAAPDYSLQLSSYEVPLERKKTASVNLYVKHPPTFAGQVSLSARPLPFVNVSISPSMLLVPLNKSTVSVSVAEFAPPGRVDITVVGRALLEGVMVERAVTFAVVVLGDPLPPPPPLSNPFQGYRLVRSDGRVDAFGMELHGDAATKPSNQRVLGIANQRLDAGYWILTSDGTVRAFGDAANFGSVRAADLKAPLIGIEPTPTGEGYWLLASDGGIFTFGDAQFYGSTGSMHLNQPIVGMESTSSGGGYWLVARDGGIFTFGDASFRGSTGNLRLNSPVVDRGTVSAFGNARNYGDLTFERPTPSIAGFDRYRI